MLDYAEKLNEAEALITEMLKDQEIKERKNGNLHYLLLHSKREIAGILKYIALHGTD